LNLAAVAVVFAAVVAVIAAMMLKSRADAIADATRNAGNLASVLAEQVDHAMDAMDASLRTTVRLTARWSAEEFVDRATGPGFAEGLRSERSSLQHADLIGIANAAGIVVGGAQGDRYANIDISDRAYFETLRDDPDHGLYVAGPLYSRSNGEAMIFLARRLVSYEGRFVGVAFMGVRPEQLLQTAHPIARPAGMSIGLFDRDGGLILRQPEPAKRAEIGRPIDASSPWHAIAASGGGLYHSDGVFDSNPKYVAVRPVPDYRLIVSVSISDAAALASWRARAAIIVVATLVGLALIAMLFYVQNILSARTETLANVNRRFGVTLDYMSHGMAIFDAQGRVLVSNHAYAELYGLPPDAIRPGMPVRDVFELRIAAGAWAGADHDAYRVYALTPPFADRTDRLANGRVILVHTKRTDEGGWVTMQEDVTERTQATERLSYMALHDNLTQLPNRAAFRNRLAETVDLDLASGRQALLLLIDLDGFKNVNDTYGHDVGDRVLTEFGARLRRAAGDAFVARLGGDEFVLIRPGGDTSEEAILRFAAALADEVGRPIDCNGRRISLALSMGALVVSDEGRDSVSVLRRADLALMEAKRRGRAQCRLFDAQMERGYDERVSLASELREAVENGALDVHYQPIVGAHDRDVVCMEALARWRHPTRGMISPGVFIPLAEENGLIPQLGAAVMRRACADAANWPKQVQVAVNVSSLQIAQPGFVQSVADILGDTGLEPQRLQIEITESVLLQNDARTIAELNALHDLGVSFALDDFGTGYASLAYLKVIPLEKVKVDKCFVDDLCANPQSIAIVGAVVALARGLGIVTTAEGVETREQYETLSALGVQTMQGYYFGRPAPLADQSFEARPLAA
jgi:diguanylate cyclase (GGDEF)-like protein